MATDPRNDLMAFRGFLDEKLSNEGANLTLDEALELREYENCPEEEREETLAAIREGIEDMNAGRTQPANEALREICRKLDLAEPS